jgi:hypothetical protein
VGAAFFPVRSPSSGLQMVLDLLTILFLVLGWVLIVIMVFERRRDVLHGPSINRLKNTQTNPPASHQNLAVRRSVPDASDEYDHLLRGIQSEVERQKQMSITLSRAHAAGTVSDKDAGLEGWGPR